VLRSVHPIPSVGPLLAFQYVEKSEKAPLDGWPSRRRAKDECSRLWLSADDSLRHLRNPSRIPRQTQRRGRIPLTLDVAVSEPIATLWTIGR
jgi:hypothetical protein